MSVFLSYLVLASLLVTVLLVTNSVYSESGTDHCSQTDSTQILIGKIIKIEQDYAAMKEKLRNLEQNVAAKGSTYIRWGRTECPGNGSELVYPGYVGGSLFNEGNAANYLCLPRDPQWKEYDDLVLSGAKVYGAEYQRNGILERDYIRFLGSDVEEEEAVCAICATSRSRVLMIPGRTTCYDGWKEEYSGYLASGYVEYKASEYICLDERPEISHKSSNASENGRLFYLVDGICGSLPCPPYVNGREITCVVCSQ